jgi:hypothetical protein
LWSSTGASKRVNLFVVVFNWSKQKSKFVYCGLQLEQAKEYICLLWSSTGASKRVHVFVVVFNWSKQKSKFVCCGLQLEQAKE